MFDSFKAYNSSCRDHSDFQVEGLLAMVKWESQMTLTQQLCNILMVGQSNISITHNIYTYSMI